GVQTCALPILHLASQGQVGGGAGLEREQLVGSRLAVEGDTELTGGHGDGDRVGPVPVDHAGDLPLPAQAAGGPRPQGASYFGSKGDVGHNGSPQKGAERWGAVGI